MASLVMASPQDLQFQSPLVRLPAEIKHIIYAYCFSAHQPIIDPVIGWGSPKDGVPPVLGIALLQTCRRVYHDVDRRTLFSRNRFCFTAVDRARSFFGTIGETSSACIHDIEINARKVHCDHPSISRQWLQYLTWRGGTQEKISGSLRADAPRLKCLRLNFQSWPSIPMFRVELWNLLRSMLLNLEGLERVLVIGASKGSGMAMRDPWSPVHFVGGDDVGSDDLIQLMWKTVEKSVDEKVIRWSRRDGKLYLEVVTNAYLVNNVDEPWVSPPMRKSHTNQWPANGSCTWGAYTNRNSGDVGNQQ